MKQTMFTALITLSLTASGAVADPIPVDQFVKLHGLIKPQAGEEKWQQIPWMIDLWAARKKAGAEGKPILLWEMDGHPLGCT
jgi:hypothetical protein